MKKLIKFWQWDNMTIEKMLDLINDTPFSMLGYDDPNLAVTKDIKEKAKYNKALSSALY